jgi:hypothetical protein
MNSSSPNPKTRRWHKAARQKNFRGQPTSSQSKQVKGTFRREVEHVENFNSVRLWIPRNTDKLSRKKSC